MFAPPPADDVEPAAVRVGRFLTLQQVADELATSVVQIRALVRSRELVGIQIGGRNQWRVEREQLEAFIQGRYRAAERDAATLDDPS